MSKKKERITQLLSLFDDKQYLTCKELASSLNISEMTVRRDLADLQASNIITRGMKAGTFTLASGPVGTREEYEFANENSKFAEEKERIAKYAASFISKDDAIIVDTGTTTSKMIKWIPDDMPFSALCYDYRVAGELLKKGLCDVILAGGQLNRSTLSFYSDESVGTIHKFRANKFFISASGIHDKLGITCGHRSELMNKQEAIRSSLTTILLADSSKFGRVQAAYFGELDEIDIIITDDKLSEEWKNIIQSKEISLQLV